MKSSSKHDAQCCQRSACSPVRSLTSSVLVQKHVGHTIVQLPQVRHRLATSSHCGDSRESDQQSRRSSSGIARPIWCGGRARPSARAARVSARVGGALRQRREHLGARRAADVDQIGRRSSPSMRSVRARS